MESVSRHNSCHGKCPIIEEKDLDGEKDEIDHISNLPDCVLSQILTKIPTKNALSTTVLSTRWKDLFQFPPSILDLDDTIILYPLKRSQRSHSKSARRAARFVKFAYKMFNVILKDVPVLTQLNLKCRKKYKDVQILYWIEAALQRCVQVLDIDTSMRAPELFFIIISGGKYPLSLTLHKSLAMHVPSRFSLPNLEHLTLDRVFFQYSEEITRLLSGCLVLKSLTMTCVHYEGADDLHISLPFLERLSIEWFAYYVPVTFDTPKLEFLYFRCYMAYPFVFRNLNSIREAHVCYEAFEPYEDMDETENMEFDEYASALVRSCSNVTKLSLSKDTISALQRSREALPVFCNLTSLELRGFDINGWRLLPRLLRNAPKLEVLIISEEFYAEKGCFEILMLSDAPYVISNLKKIEILKVKGVLDELNLIKYLLAVGKVLKRIEITCHESSEKHIDQIVSYLSDFNLQHKVILKNKCSLIIRE